MKINHEMTQMLKFAKNVKAVILTMFTEKKKNIIIMDRKSEHRKRN